MEIEEFTSTFIKSKLFPLHFACFGITKKEVVSRWGKMENENLDLVHFYDTHTLRFARTTRLKTFFVTIYIFKEKVE